MTRKRSWKDADGKIVAKRPHLEGIEESDKAETSNPPNEAAPLLSPPLSFGALEVSQDGVNHEIMDDNLHFDNDQVLHAEFERTLLDSASLFPDVPNTNTDDTLFESAFNPDTGIIICLS